MKINKLSLLVLAQELLLILVYLVTIALGAGLVYIVFYASIRIIPPFYMFVAMYYGRAGGLLLIAVTIAIAGLWAFFVSIGVYLIKPLFTFPKTDKGHRLEIKRENSPMLYDMIMSTAEAVGVRKPKHIYVDHEVNACVFFNTGFWNIFFPVRKNLLIGLGLFESTNIEEVRSIIAHEFGHFAQGRMRVSSVIYTTDRVIRDLVYRRDKLDSFMLRWCRQDCVWGFWGKATQFVLIRFRSLIDYMYRSQQRNYMKLRRQMEYDADAVACRIVGSETFISAICKIQKLSKSFNFYNEILINFANNKLMVSNYWDGYEKTRPWMDTIDIGLTSFDSVENTPELENIQSRVSIEEIFESHPPIEKRIKHAQSLSIIINNSKLKVPAWDLVPEALKTKISQRLLNQLNKSNDSISILGWDDFSEILSQKVEFSFFPKDVEVFFDRDIIITDSESSSEENPLMDENRTLIIEYEQALRDKHLLSLLNKGKIPVKHFTYNGINYSINNVPIIEHDQYVNELKIKASIIDSTIRRHTTTKAKDRSLVIAAYDAIGYAQLISASIKNDFIPVREDLIKELNEAKIVGDGDFYSLREWLDSYKTALKELLGSLKYCQLTPFIKKDEYEHMMHFLDTPRSFVLEIDNSAIRHMFTVTDWILQVHTNLAYSAKMVIARIILDKDIPDVRFLELWYPENINASQNNKTAMSD